MISWHEVPIFRIFIAFLAGIFIAIYSNSNEYTPILLYLPGLLLLSAYLFWPDKVITYSSRWIIGFGIFSLFTVLGYNCTKSRDPQSESNFLGNIIDARNPAFYQVRILEPPQETEKQLKVKIEVEKIFYNRKGKIHSFKIKGNAICYLKKGQEISNLKYSDLLLLKARFTTPPKVLNPGAFDYKKYLEFKHTYHVTHCKPGDWKTIGHDNNHPVFEIAYRWQASLAAIFSANGMKNEEYSVGAAMLLGKYENFSQELRNSYAAAGVTHILSVSGLHVGIVFIVLNHLLFFLNGNKKLRILKAILLITLTWFYALITGLSPPVQRAAAMFTFLIAGKARNRNSNIFNTLAASALLLLLVDPYLIADIGFELSYLAVLGIVIAGNPLYQLLTPANYITDKLWQLVAISLGAQLLTGPLAVFYFHQFPTWFIPANMLIIPLSTIVMYIGMAVLVVSPFEIICHWITKLFTWSIELMNFLIERIENLPYASLKGLYISFHETILLFAIGICLTIFIHYRKGWQLLSGLILLWIFIISAEIKSVIKFKERTIAVYALRSGTAIGFISGKKQELLLDSSATAGKNYLLSQITDFTGVRGVKNSEITEFDSIRLPIPAPIKGFTFLSKFGQKIAIVEPEFNPQKKVTSSLPIDILIITGKVKTSTDRLFTYFHPGKIVICMSVKPWKSDQIIADCKKNDIPFYDIATNGAFVLSW